MRHERGSVLWVLLILVTVAALAEGYVIFRLERRVKALEGGTGSATGSTNTPLALGEEVRQLDESVTLMKDHLRKVDERIDKAVAAAAAAPDPVLAADAAGAEMAKTAATANGLPEGALEEAVAKAVEKKLDEELPNREGGEWKPSIQELKEKLALYDDQTQRAERIFDDAKHEVFQLLSLERADGTAKVDDLVDAFRSPDPEAEMKKWFSSLFTEKIPGREVPYIVEALQISEKTKKALSTVVDQDQAKKLNRLNLDYLGVKTAYDPFAEYVQESLR